MSRLMVCRLCLADDLPLRKIANTYLQEIFEKLTDVQLMPDNMKPAVVCYVCCVRLHQSYQLRMNSVQSEDLLDQIIQGLIPQNQQKMPRSFVKALVAVISTSGEGWDDMPVPPKTPVDKNEMIKQRRTSDAPLQKVLAVNSELSKISVDNIEIIESDEDHSETKAIKRETEQQTDLGVKETGRSITERLIIESITEEIEIKREPDIEEKIIQPPTKQIIQPPTEQIVQPPTRQIVQPPTKQIVQPPTREIVQPPTRQIVRPPTKQIVQPPTKQIIQPPTKQIVQPPTKQIVQPPTKQIVQPPTREIVQPPTRQIVRPPTREIVQPPTKQIVQPPTKIVQPPTKQIVQPRTNQITQTKNRCLKKKRTNSEQCYDILDSPPKKKPPVFIEPPKIIYYNQVLPTLIALPPWASPIPQNVIISDSPEAPIWNPKGLNLSAGVEEGFIFHQPILQNPAQTGPVWQSTSPMYCQSDPKLLTTSLIDTKIQNGRTEVIEDGGAVKIQDGGVETVLQSKLISPLVLEENKNTRTDGDIIIHPEEIKSEQLKKICTIENNNTSIVVSEQNAKNHKSNLVNKIEMNKNDIKKTTAIAGDQRGTTQNGNNDNSSNIRSSTESNEPENNFKCHVCNKSFPKMGGLVLHIRKDHPNVLPYECNICKNRFPGYPELTMHLRTHIIDPNAKCDICGKTLNTPKLIQSHKCEIKVKNTVKCHVCDKGFPKKRELIKHIRLDHPNVLPLECNICKERFARRKEVFQHMRSHNDPNLKCDVCNIQFMSTTTLQIHLKQIHDETNDIKEVTTGVERSSSTSESDANINCDVCNMAFDSTESLHAHIKSLHDKTDIEKPTAENVENVTTSETVDLTEPVKFDCHVCNETFPRMGGLVVHIRKNHPKVLPYECYICKRRLSKNALLNKHMRIHTDPVIFKCDVCNITLNSKNKLTIHKRRQHNIKASVS